MKRFAAMLAALVLLWGVACAEGRITPQDREADSYMGDLLSLLGANRNVLVFDYQAPEGTLLTVLTLWTLEDGAWTKTCILGGGLAGQGELCFEDCLGAGYSMAVAGYGAPGTAVEDSSKPVFDTRKMHSGMMLLQEQVTGPMNVEIPIAIQMFSAADDLPKVALSLYADPAALANVNYAYAVTVCFTDAPVEPIGMDGFAAEEAINWEPQYYVPAGAEWSGWEGSEPIGVGIPGVIEE